MEIHDFIKEMEDEDNKMDYITSPTFKLAGVDFSIDVIPDNIDHNASEFIGVYLQNYGDEDQITSFEVEEASGVEKNNWKMDKVEAGDLYGFHYFLSHKKYRELAKVHGDVLKLDILVTLHSKAEDDGWTR